MAESGLDSLRATHEIEVTWKSYELRPPEAPPISPEAREQYRQRIKAGSGRMKAHALDVFGLEMGDPQHSASTRLAHQAAKFAEDHGQGDPYRHALFAAHWQDGRNIGDVETLVALANECSLDGESLRQALVNGDYLDVVKAEEHEAQWHGLQGVPAFVFGGKYLVSGAQPLDVLKRIADKVTELQAQGDSEPRE